MKRDTAVYKFPVTVKSVRRVTLDVPTPVYDATSPQFHNFALANGVIVHNTAKKACNKDTDEVLPLRGKVMNAYRVPKGKRIWDSEAIMDILKAIGFDPEAENPGAKLRVGKIVLLGDADVDGWHINLLNLSLLAKVVPQVFDKGMVYIARGYEYIIEDGDTIYVGDTVSEIKAAAPARLHRSILHLKGWGEVSYKGLRYMVFDPATAKLIRITSTKKCLNHLHQLMGDDRSLALTMLGLK